MARLGEFATNELDFFHTITVNNYQHNFQKNNVTISTENISNLLIEIRILEVLGLSL